MTRDTFTFKLGHCSACGRMKPLKGKRCYDCYVAGYTKKSSNIPWKVEKRND